MADNLDERWMEKIIEAAQGLESLQRQVAGILEAVNGKEGKGIIFQLQMLGLEVERIRAENSLYIKEEVLRLRAENGELRQTKNTITAADMTGKWSTRDTAIKGLYALLGGAMAMFGNWLLGKP